MSNLKDGLESPDINLRTHPKQFKQLLEAAVLWSVLLSEPELDVKGRVIDGVVQALLQDSSNGALQLNGRKVTIDRVAVLGSASKTVIVQGQFDVDLVSVNLPAGIRVDLCDPDTCLQDGSWMVQLQSQLVPLLQRELDRSPQLQLVGDVQPPHPGSTAIKFTVSEQVPGSRQRLKLDCDLVLAPNFATGAGAEAAAQYSVVPLEGEPAADTQRRAVLAPVLRLADGVQHAYLRSAWLAEASTEFVQEAVVAAAQRGGLSGRVVTSTIRLVMAWVG